MGEACCTLAAECDTGTGNVGAEQHIAVPPPQPLAQQSHQDGSTAGVRPPEFPNAPSASGITQSPHMSRQEVEAQHADPGQPGHVQQLAAQSAADVSFDAIAARIAGKLVVARPLPSCQLVLHHCRGFNINRCHLSLFGSFLLCSEAPGNLHRRQSLHYRFLLNHICMFQVGLLDLLYARSSNKPA